MNKRQTITVIQQGQLFKVKVPGLPMPAPEKRGSVGSFSAASKRRILELCARLERSRGGRVSFITLTYPQRFPGPRKAKEHLRALLERMRRHPNYVGMSAIWKLEPQARGAPHFHLLCFNAPFVPHNKLRRAWWEITAEYCDTDAPGYIWIQEVRSWRGVMHYVAKYMGKACEPVEPETAAPRDSGSLDHASYPHAEVGHNPQKVDSWKTPGRWWGVWKGQDLPFAEIHVLELPDGDWFNEFFVAGKRRSQYLALFDYSSSFTLYTEDPGTWARLISEFYESHGPPEAIVKEWHYAPRVWGQNRTDLCKIDRDALDAVQTAEVMAWVETQPEVAGDGRED